MKNSKDVAKELWEEIEQYTNIADYIGEHPIKFLANYFTEFEKDIRKDQDEKTAKCCADRIKAIEEFPQSSGSFQNGDGRQGFGHPISTGKTFKTLAIEACVSCIDPDAVDEVEYNPHL